MYGVFRDYNLSIEQVVEAIKQDVAPNLGLYERVRLRCVAAKAGDKWLNTLCVLHAFPQQRVPEKQVSQRYPNLHFLEGWLDPSGLVECVTQLG